MGWGGRGSPVLLSFMTMKKNILRAVAGGGILFLFHHSFFSSLSPHPPSLQGPHTDRQ